MRASTPTSPRPSADCCNRITRERDGPGSHRISRLAAPPEVLDRPQQPRIEADRRLPPQELPGPGDVGATADGIVLRQRPVLDG